MLVLSPVTWSECTWCFIQYYDSGIICVRFSFFFMFCIFLFPQNDQSTEDLHIVGAEDLSFLTGKVTFFLSSTENSVAFYKEQHLCPGEHHSKLISKTLLQKTSAQSCLQLVWRVCVSARTLIFLSPHIFAHLCVCESLNCYYRSVTVFVDNKSQLIWTLSHTL